VEKVFALIAGAAPEWRTDVSASPGERTHGRGRPMEEVHFMGTHQLLMAVIEI
jgi:hypothetical protein